ncbi:uncharacterized protein PG998_001399 [Apiospora kogelbergensis]|uniref:Uncharacterized protein n=1 Tax=Apiospora kogelbergensis TaxID=1337665 RepID=A0AAW0QPS0_9PEZI
MCAFRPVARGLAEADEADKADSQFLRKAPVDVARLLTKVVRAGAGGVFSGWLPTSRPSSSQLPIDIFDEKLPPTGRQAIRN